MVGALAGLSFLAWTRLDPPLQTTAQKITPPSLPSRQDQWRILGPGGGGAEYIPRVSPYDQNLVLVACDMGGGYVSEDGGSSWREFNIRGRIREYAFDSQDPNTIYAVNTLLWRSGDRGRTWNLVYPEPQNIHGFEPLGDDEAAMSPVLRPWRTVPVSAFAVDPGNSNDLYLSSGGTLMKSRDRGRSWNKVATLPGAPSKIVVDPRSPANRRRLYLVSGGWTAVWDSEKLLNFSKPSEPSWIYDSAIGFPASGPAVMYVIVDFRMRNGALSGGLLVSKDDGASWQPAYGGLLDLRMNGSKEFPSLAALALCSSHPDVLYVSLTRMQLPGDRWVFGVAKSTDGAAHWQMVWQENDKPAANVFDAWTSEAFGPGWAENPINLSVQPSNPNVVYGTDYARTMRSTDGGKTWAAVYSHRIGTGWSTTGLDVTTAYSIFFDPFDSKKQFIAYTDIGLFRSEDGGTSWIYSSKGVPRTWRNTTYWVAFDPQVKGRMWAAVSGTHDLPRMKMFKKGTAAFKGGVVKSEDGGKTWTSSNAGMSEAAITHLIIDPNSPANHRTLYAAAMGHGVYRSTDDGASWTLQSNGLIGPEPRAWRMALDAAHKILYLVTTRLNKDGTYGGDGDGMLYRSTNEAGNWERVKLPDGVNGLNGIALDPADPQRIYLAAWGRFNTRLGKDPKQGGVWLSPDGGRTWHNVNATDQYMYDVTIDPKNPQIVYAASFQSSIWRSADRGETWKRIRGFNFWAAHRIIPDPLDPQAIYVATCGSSIWHGPALGDPQAHEDIVSPPSARYTQ
jgi:photosystem II stability/assembly factor-like uncharacterized protein